MAKRNKSMEQNESQETLKDSDVLLNTDTSKEINRGKEQCESSVEEKPATENNQPEEPTIEQLQAELAAERDRVLRLSAEFDNYKKRSAREMADFRKFANEALFKQLLTVMDNLERALSSASLSTISSSTEACASHSGTDTQNSSIIQGVELTCKDIIKLFESFNVKPVEAQGKPFDPNFHQAVSHQESDKYPDNTVIAELQKGYILHERLLRPSMVIVSKAISKQDSIS